MTSPIYTRCRLLLHTLAVAFVIFAFPAPAHAGESQDGRDHPLQDTFLDGLVGSWHVVRVMKNRTVENTVQAEWVLNHQFLRLHYRDVATPSKYEAMVFIGYDNAEKHYVVHWIDVFGGHFSSRGSGQREGNALAITFQYPDAEFRNTFTFNPKEHTWTSLMRQKDKASGEWTTFAEDSFRGVPVK
jgi:hypothetical protein